MSLIACRAILFDLDGVLVDSTACVERTWQRWANQHKVDYAAIMKISHGRRSVETISLVAPHLVAQEEAALLENIESRETDGVIEVPGARRILESLPQTSWAIVTSGTLPVATLRLKHTGLPVPGIMITSEDVTNGKPHPEGYLAAARRLGFAPEDCLVIEDAPAGIAAAQAAGMRAVAVATTHEREQLRQADLLFPTLDSIYLAALPVGIIQVEYGADSTSPSF
jgi:sugar-phosphatase